MNATDICFTLGVVSGTVGAYLYDGPRLSLLIGGAVLVLVSLLGKKRGG